ncbi:hypothetical protein [Seonamhaeicola marinus]|uniref:Lipoprotein n=1 Tax=Seonamhaeicola marinus TaxID=1912246 RepID=A0A5D0HNG8_9FLAO|nr:hypothetical protein [Seonamhaeicola marinus]TYA71617.1 hypothetical protein FUA24_18775 [Seonamhaeicola marinus]
MKRLTTILISIFFVACNTPDAKQEEDDILQALCLNSAEFHFSGYINDEVKCFSDGLGNYQRYSGGAIEGHEDPIGVFTMGINTWPLNNGDEAIFINTPKVDTKNANDVIAKLPIGELPLQQRQEFHLWYRVIDQIRDVSNMITTELEAKFDENSAITITEVEKENNDLYDGTTLKVSMTISCRLYDQDDKMSGSIESASFTGRIYVNDIDD